MPSAVIAGAGVIGSLCAYELARAGWRVTLLDKGALGGGCSHGNCGYVSPSHVLPMAGPGALLMVAKTLFARNSPVKVRPGFALAHLGWFLGFARRCTAAAQADAAAGIAALLKSSRTLYDRLIAAEALDVEWDQRGLLFVLHTAKGMEHFAETDRLLREQYDTPADRLDAAALCALEPGLIPDRVSGGFLYRMDAMLRPDALMRELRRVLLGLGVTLVENAEMTGLLPGAGGTAGGVRTATGDYPADHVVVATGAWTPQLAGDLGLKVPIVPGKGYSITVPRPAADGPTYPMIFEEHRVAVSPFASGLRIGSTMEFAGYDAELNRDRLGLLTDTAAFYLKNPGLDGAAPREEWWGWRPMVYDGRPLIGRGPRYGNVVVAAGHGMLGLSMATGTGRLVKELLCGEPPHLDAAQYSPTRF